MHARRRHLVLVWSIASLFACRDATNPETGQVQRLSAYPAQIDGMTTLEWDRLGGDVISYRIFSIDAGGQRTQIGEVPVHVDQGYFRASFDVSGLPSGTLGTYAVAGVNEGGEGPISQPASATAGNLFQFAVTTPSPGYSGSGQTMIIQVSTNNRGSSSFVASIDDHSAVVQYMGDQGVTGIMNLSGLTPGNKQLIVRGGIVGNPAVVMATIALTLQ